MAIKIYFPHIFDKSSKFLAKNGDLVLTEFAAWSPLLSAQPSTKYHIVRGENYTRNLKNTFQKENKIFKILEDQPAEGLRIVGTLTLLTPRLAPAALGSVWIFFIPTFLIFIFPTFSRFCLTFLPFSHLFLTFPYLFLLSLTYPILFPPFPAFPYPFLPFSLEPKTSCD